MCSPKGDCTMQSPFRKIISATPLLLLWAHAVSAESPTPTCLVWVHVRSPQPTASPPALPHQRGGSVCFFPWASSFSSSSSFPCIAPPSQICGLDGVSPCSSSHWAMISRAASKAAVKEKVLRRVAARRRIRTTRLHPRDSIAVEIALGIRKGREAAARLRSGGRKGQLDTQTAGGAAKRLRRRPR